MRAGLVLLLASAVAAVASAPAAAAVDRLPPERPKAPPARCTAGAVLKVGDARTSYAAVVPRRAIAFRRPGGRELARFGARNVNGFPTVFAVLSKRVDSRCRALWYRVQLPLKPNGTIGWVRSYWVTLAPVRTRIVVDLSDRRVLLYERGRRVLAATAAIGARATPTPTGRYYVNQRLVPRDRSGPFGPGAVGISAFSEVLTGWVQGGPIAIHGTNRPELLGQRVSNGCIRIHNSKLIALFKRAVAGTPVTVRA